MSRRSPWLALLGVCVAAPVLAQEAPPVLVDDEQGDVVLVDDDEGGVVLDTVVVTGSRTEHRLSDAPVATELVTREDIETSGAETAADVLEEHPGIELSRSFRGAGVRLQGLDSKHVLILIDGERVGGRIDGVVDLARIPAEDIERIEIVKGPSSALYGSDAMGGVINVITRRAGETVEAEAHASYGSMNAGDMSGRVGVRMGGWNTRISGGWHGLDAFDLSPDDPATSGSGMSQWNIANRTEYRFDDSAAFVFGASYLRRDQQGVDSNAAGAVFDRRNLTEVLSASLGPEFRFTAPAKLRITGHYSLFRDQFLLDQRQSAALDQDQETREHLAQITTQYDHLLFDQHLLTVGSEGVYERLESQRLESGEGDRYRAALFVQDEWTILEDPLFILVPGGRVDVDSHFGTHATPKIALRFDPHETLTLRASYGMGFRAPVFKELLLLFENPSAGYVVEGNPELEPETSHSFNVGAEYLPVNWAWFSLSLFRNTIDNLIFTEAIDGGGVGAPQRYAYVNVASAYTQGLEARVRVRLVRSLTLEAGYALTDSRDLEHERALEGRALHRGTFDLRYRHKSWGFDATARAAFVGPRPFYADADVDGGDETQHSDPHATVDLRLGQRLGDHLTLFAGVENLLDAGDAEYLPIQPRTFYGGITGRL